MEPMMDVIGKHGPEAAGIFGYMGTEPLVEVHLEHGYILECKPGHRLWASKGEAWDWRHVEDLIPGDLGQIRGGDNLWSDDPDLVPGLVELIAADVKDGKVGTEGLPLSIRTANQKDVEAFLARLPETLTLQDELAAQDLQVMWLNSGWLTSREGATVTKLRRLDGPTEDLRVVRVESVGTGPTYDINVPGSSTIVTNGIVSHNSDVRFRQVSRALSAAPFAPKAGPKMYDEQEPSVEYDGNDRYRYVHVKAHKNKLWTPQRECFIRIWVEDGSGTARGLDPVFDTLYYLQQTGQLSGRRARMTLDLEDLGPAKKTVSWAQLKAWVLGDRKTMIEISKELGYKPMSLRKFCFNQMKKGIGESLYVKQAQQSRKKKSEDEDD